jgi:hypothetical protein
VDLSVARELARQRAGRKRDGETDEEYEARVLEKIPRANSPEVAYMGESARARVIHAEEQRRLGTKGRSIA